LLKQVTPLVKFLAIIKDIYDSSNVRCADYIAKMFNCKITIGFLIIAYYIYTSLITISNHLLFKQYWLWLDPNVHFWGVHIPTRWSKNFE